MVDIFSLPFVTLREMQWQEIVRATEDSVADKLLLLQMRKGFREDAAGWHSKVQNMGCEGKCCTENVHSTLEVG